MNGQGIKKVIAINSERDMICIPHFTAIHPTLKTTNVNFMVAMEEKSWGHKRHSDHRE